MAREYFRQKAWAALYAPGAIDKRVRRSMYLHARVRHGRIKSFLYAYCGIDFL